GRRRSAGMEFLERRTEHARDHRHAFARLVFALGPQLVELDEASQPDDRQEDEDEDGDELAEKRLSRKQLLVGGVRQQLGVTADGGAPRKAESEVEQTPRGSWLCRRCPRHARPPRWFPTSVSGRRHARISCI